jgi:hypothetical protein
MLPAERSPHIFADVNQPKKELLEIHRSKISLHYAKAGYTYPTIRLPHTLSKLAGLPTRIYQTMHDGSLAFLVVVSSKDSDELQENAAEIPKRPVDSLRKLQSN